MREETFSCARIDLLTLYRKSTHKLPLGSSNYLINLYEFNSLAQVIRRWDDAMHWINRLPVDSKECFVTLIRWMVIYALDTVIRPLNNWALMVISLSRPTLCHATPRAMDKHRLKIRR